MLSRLLSVVLVGSSLLGGLAACGAGTASPGATVGGAGGSGGTGSGGTGSGGTGSGGTDSGSSGGQSAAGGGGTGGTGASCAKPTPDAQYPVLTECGGASLDRLQKWWGTAEGPTIPGDGQSLLTTDSCGAIAQVEFASAPSWHVAPVWIANEFVGADVSAASELRIEYSATSDFWVQLRPLSTYSGGNKWHHLLPSTGGALKVLVIPLTPDAWTEKFGPPPTTVADALKELCGLVFVGNTNNKITIRSLRIEGYEPPCK